MLSPSTFTPTLFIGIGQLNCYFTLRETHLHAVPGEGPYGNAVVNGVYQGSYEVRHHHVKNLSQDANEAFEKAVEAAEAMGLRLTTTRDQLTQELNEIRRASREELERREREHQERMARWEAERAVEDERLREVVRAGFFAQGPYCGKHFSEAPRGYLTWMADKVAEFSEGSLIQLTAQEIPKHVAELLLPKAHPTLHVGSPKERKSFDVVCIRHTSFVRPSFGYGATVERVHVTTMIDKSTGACLVALTPSWAADEGEEFRIKATVKEHSEYRGQAQTIVQRVVVL